MGRIDTLDLEVKQLLNIFAGPQQVLTGMTLQTLALKREEMCGGEASQVNSAKCLYASGGIAQKMHASHFPLLQMPL